MNRKIKNRYKVTSRASEDRLRISVFRSCNHVYAQVIDRTGKILAEASTCAKACPVYSKPKMEKAVWVGKTLAGKMDLNGKKFFYDRGEYAYHGVIKALADAAREAGMEF